jgi:hypothetical protein
MTHLFHLAFLGRFANQFGDQILFTDGLPPPTQEELDSTRDDAEAEWHRQQNPPKSWPDVEAFIAEFTMDEMVAMSLSSDPTIAGLRLLLSAWRSSVQSDDPRVILGLNALVNTGIISRHRQLEILNAPM